ncbi:flagellar basal body rod protein FlgB [Tenuibacillus multivorans]|uniref:Flagellar basal body rod protein FlgB n=1 Tax=Tenuibacillus multivorans TaxID=237069 RepID=A0A1G9XZ94_9BACI|nr:flagellar basal body rod protein FlgB [Tenuibacillus multivorans]GEL75884.1 flagellar basal body rod protein FlgB [Tenuibacillus multivorans]SDN02139.1 flagellar basal-body rod protein FlgB [Tenuibacillus multivorans]
MKLFGSTMNNLEQGLKYASLKNKTIAHNLANIDTPNYKAKDVTFKEQLGQAQSRIEAKRTHSKHIPFSTSNQGIEITSRENVTYNHNGNSVDIDKEMTELAENQIYYQALIDRVNGKFNSIKTILRGGN